MELIVIEERFHHSLALVDLPSLSWRFLGWFGPMQFVGLLERVLMFTLTSRSSICRKLSSSCVFVGARETKAQSTIVPHPHKKWNPYKHWQPGRGRATWSGKAHS